MLVNDLAESKITVKKTDLLETLKLNRATHFKDFEEALDGFKETAKEKMQENLDLLTSTGKVNLVVYLAVSVEHTKEYDRVIRMLEMSTADEITISEGQFTQYVMDDWNWKSQFQATSQMYNNKQ